MRYGGYKKRATITTHPIRESDRYDEVSSAIQSGSIALLKGRWLLDFMVQEWNLGKVEVVLPYRQLLPSEEAFYTWEEISRFTINFDRIIVISHMWLQPDHPDPKGTTLLSFCDHLYEIKGLAEYAVFWDWASLYQHPDPKNNIFRNEQQEELFRDGLETLPILFSSPDFECWKVTELPNSYPTGYNLPTNGGANTAEYYHRGWPLMESSLSSIGKEYDKVSDISRSHRTKTKVEETGRTISNDRRSPLTPERMDALFRSGDISFTNQKQDLPLVSRLYKKEFVHCCYHLETAEFHNVGWNDNDIQMFSEVIENGYTPNLISLKLDRNRFGVQGCKALANALSTSGSTSTRAGTIPLLHEINLGSNRCIGDDGVIALAEILVQTQVVILSDTNLGVVGCLALAIAARKHRFSYRQSSSSMPTMTELDLENNESIGDDGIVVLADVLVQIQNIDLCNTGIGIIGCEALAKEVIAVTTTNYTSNKMNRKQQSSIQQMPLLLKTLDLSKNRTIGDDGIMALADAILQINDVRLRDTNLGVKACKALARATNNIPPQRMLIQRLSLQDNDLLTIDTCGIHLEPFVQNCSTLKGIDLDEELQEYATKQWGVSPAVKIIR